MSRRKPRREIFDCPHCGADVPIGSKACRECGSDAGSGWQDSEEIDYASVEIPDGYGEPEPVAGARNWRRIVVALLLILTALFAFVLLR